MGKISNFIWEMGGEFLAELFSLGQIKKIVGRSMAGRATKAGEGDKDTEIKWSGLFTLEDEKAFFTVFAKMQRNPETINVAKNITDFMNGLEEAQRRRFRVVVGMLAGDDFAKIIERTPLPGSRSTTKSEGDKDSSGGEEKPKEKTKEERINLGAEFLIWFSRLSHFEKLEFCRAAGILDGTLDLLKKEISEAIRNGKRVSAWLQKWAAENDSKIKELFVPGAGQNGKTNFGDRAKSFRSWAEDFRKRQ